MRVTILLILPMLMQGRSIVKERDVVKQTLTPTLIRIIRHARMREHGAKIDNLLDFMEEEKMLDPFLQWLGWFTDKGEKEEEEEDKKEEDGDQRREPEDG